MNKGSRESLILCIIDVLSKKKNYVKYQDVHNLVYELSKKGYIKIEYNDWERIGGLGVRSKLLDYEISYLIMKGFIDEETGKLKKDIYCSDYSLCEIIHKFISA